MAKRSMPVAPIRFSPPPAAHAAAGRRLLTLCLLLVLVLGLMAKSRRPESWSWLWRGQRAIAESDGIERAPLPSTDRYLPDLKRELLTAVSDDTTFSVAEQPAWFHLLQLLQRHPAADVAAVSVGRVSYLQLARQTAAYRGQVVELSGTLRRLQQVRAPVNEQGITQYWQGWLFLEDGPVAPIVVYSLELPEGITPGQSMDTRIDVTACVFKRWAYGTANGLTVAPVVLARSFTWQPLPTASGDASRTVPSGKTLAIACFVSCLAAWMAVGWIWRNSRRGATSPSRGRRDPADRLDWDPAHEPGAPTGATAEPTPTPRREPPQ